MPSPSNPSTNLSSVLLTALLGALLALFLSFRFRPAALKPPLPDPSYSPAIVKCGNPPSLRERYTLTNPSCITLISASTTSLHARLNLPNSTACYLLRISVAHCPSQSPVARVLNEAPTIVTITNLRVDTDYTLELFLNASSSKLSLVCHVTLSTLSQNNLLRNPSFEQVADPPYLATRFRTADQAAPRRWTPFYNGRAKRVCGIHHVGEEYYEPRSGDCMLMLGGTEQFGRGHALFHGVHQGVRVNGPVLVGAWYRVAGVLKEREKQESSDDRLAMVVGGWGNDGVIVPLQNVKEWTRVCVTFEGQGFVHVYFHFHDFESGILLVEDVEMRAIGKGGAVEGCYTHSEGRNNRERKQRKPRVKINLEAEVAGGNEQLTLAVPLTAGRVLRLEAMSRLYGGGPIIAAVAVTNEQELRIFRRIWEGKVWLRKHVSVSFVRRKQVDGPLAINALRNIAVHAAQTEFVMMVDVDMTPATASFKCFRDLNGSWLHWLVPKGSKRILAPPVFIGDVQHRSAVDKDELRNLLVTRAGTSYCLNSQRSNKIKRWYGEREVVETRFLTDYEPYGIVRRDEYPEYDERFSGYGFNKISWAYGAEVAGWRTFVLPESFLTHLNHVENDWVQNIDVAHYLQTWRRFLAFAEERGGHHGVSNPHLPRRSDGKLTSAS